MVFPHRSAGLHSLGSAVPRKSYPYSLISFTKYSQDGRATRSRSSHSRDTDFSPLSLSLPRPPPTRSPGFLPLLILFHQHDRLKNPPGDAIKEARRFAEHHTGGTVEDIDRIGDEQVLFRAGGGDIHQAALFFEFFFVFVVQRGEATIYRPDDEDRVPL